MNQTGENYAGRGDIPSKLSAFDKLVRHAISRFSMDRVYDLLRIVSTELRSQKPIQVKEASTKSDDKGETVDKVDANETEVHEDNGSGTENKSLTGSDADNKSVKSDNSNDGVESTSGKSGTSNSSYGDKPETTTPSNNATDTKTVDINSLKQVRDVVNGLELKEASGEKLNDRQIVALRHFSTFAKDIAYLRESRTYFHKNVYWCLLEDFYDPNEPLESRLSLSPPDSDKRDPTELSQTVGGRINRKVKPSRRPPKNGKKPEAPKENDRKRIHKVVSELEEAMRKWNELLEDGELKIEYFDDDSNHEVVHYLHCAPFELVFRVVPDVFIKCYRALDLAREWIKIAEKIYKGRLPLRRKVKGPEEEEEEDEEEEGESTERDEEETVVAEQQQKEGVPEQEVPEQEEDPTQVAARNYKSHMKKIQSRIVDVTEVLQQHEQQMTELTKEMAILKAREVRVDKLNANFENADSQLQTAQKEFTKYLNERQKTIDEISEIPSGSIRHSELSKKADVLERELTKRRCELSLLEYQKSVVQEDFLLELELRPTFIHFVGDVQVRMTDITMDVHDKKTEKEKLEKQLSLMITNTDKVQAVMTQYLGREPTDGDVEIAVRLASTPLEAESDEEDEERTENPGDLDKYDRMSDEESDVDYWQKEPENYYDSDGTVGLESDLSFVSVSDDVDLTDYLPENVVFHRGMSPDRIMSRKTGTRTLGNCSGNRYLPQSSQQFSDAMRVLSPNSAPKSQRGYVGPRRLKPHSKIYKQMHSTSYRPS